MANLPAKNSQYLETLNLERELLSQETVWLQNFTSEQTQRAYKLAFREFIDFHKLTSPKAFRSTTDAQVIEYRDHLKKTRKLSNRSIRSKIAAISSCFQHLQAHGIVKHNPTDGIQRPKVNEKVGETPVMTAYSGPI